jgi:hypothetical protein
MLRKPVFGLLMVVVLLVAPISTVLAQGGTPPLFCGDLSEADCAILAQSQAAMTGLTSSAVKVSMDLGLTGMEEPEDSFAMSLLVDGAYEANSELMATLGQMASPEDMGALMSAGMDVIVDLLRGVKGDAGVEIVLPAELAAEMDIPMETLTTRLVMVDGVLYVNLETLIPAEAQGEDAAEMPAWIGVDLAGMYEMLSSSMMEEAGENMPDFQELFATEEFATLYDVNAWGDFMDIVRLADAEVAGQSVAVFEMVMDYGAVFTSEAFQEAFAGYMDKVMELSGEEAEKMPDNFMDVMAAMMGGMSLKTTQWIGLQDFYVHRMDMDFAFAFDKEAIAAIAPNEAEDIPENFSMAMKLVVDSSAFNVPVEVVAPAGAQVINPMMFMGMGEDSSG